MTAIVVERLESMSPDGRLRLYIQPDGDVIVAVLQSEGDANGSAIASVEFCTPGAGRGGSPRTWHALGKLAEAMALDNLHDTARKGEFSGEELL